MKTIAVTGQKGGVGKTTLAVHIAENLHRTLNVPVSLIDRDPQQAAARWGAAFGLPGADLKTPLGAAVRERKEAGDAFCVIDTAPSIGGAFKDIHSVADIVLLPTQASMLDITSLGTALGALRATYPALRIFAVLNQIDERLVITREAVAGLDAAEVPQFATHIMRRTGYTRAALTAVYPHPEIDALVREIRNHLAK